ncbi:LysR family transcriptional regulator [Actinacidiphila acidipaludis]|uniref:LysR family transcriptional regulator n=1 Tax=Actinacidiphila acidipaludis TaxID=2873382 RepID=A0ABS7Q8D7_9ACTN|nr:LysR family transcriptional regulator [Streptomyces acidipaludis]MBY8879413.1 LysR family transcriptional regulator [Streptomyces acidipaludis]
MDLDLRKVRYFVAVAERLHFSRAAEELLIAQPALSRQIRALEKDLGTALFVRDSHGVELTAAGRQLLDDAGPLLAAADAARRRVDRAARGDGTLVVGFRAGITVTGAVRAFAVSHPGTRVEVRRVEWDDQADAVRDGRVDLAFVRLPVTGPGLDVRPLYREPRMAALPAAHPLAARDAVTRADLGAQAEILHLCTDPEPGGAPPLSAVRTVEEKLEYVAAGRGVTYLPLSATLLYRRPDVVYRPVADLPPDEVALATAAGRASRLAEAFAATALRTIVPPGAALPVLQEPAGDDGGQPGPAGDDGPTDRVAVTRS